MVGLPGFFQPGKDRFLQQGVYQVVVSSRLKQVNIALPLVILFPNMIALKTQDQLPLVVVHINMWSLKRRNENYYRLGEMGGMAVTYARMAIVGTQ